MIILQLIAQCLFQSQEIDLNIKSRENSGVQTERGSDSERNV